MSRSVQDHPSMLIALALGGLLSACAAACAAGAASKRDALRAGCEADLAYDPSCIEVLTSAGGFETREHVLKADEDREAEAFRARLARMRKAEEERQGARAPRTSTAGMTAPTDLDGAALGDLLRTDRDSGGSEGETGSSVRALRLAPEDSTETARAEPTERPLAADESRSRPPPEAAPTPESYLRGAHCLLADEGSRLREALEREKKPRDRGRASKERQGALALAIVETDALLSSIEAEIAHRGLPRGVTAETCGAATLEAVGLLRRAAGLEVKTGAGVADAERYGSGLVQLRQALELRAGLPRRP